MTNEMIKNIGLMCREYRVHILGLTLKEFSNITDTNYKNIHAFESGRANNIVYLSLYYNVSTDVQKKLFASKLFNLL